MSSFGEDDDDGDPAEYDATINLETTDNPKNIKTMAKMIGLRRKKVCCRVSDGDDGELFTRIRNYDLQAQEVRLQQL